MKNSIVSGQKTSRTKTISMRFLAISACIALVAACGSDNGGSSASSGEAPEEVAIAVRSDVDNFNPYKSGLSGGTRVVFDGIYDTLVRADPENPTELVGSLATDWSVTPDSATFALREGVTCADGSEITASGVAKSLEYMGAPDSGSLFVNSVYGPGGLKSIEVDDESNQITINLGSRFSGLLSGLAAYGYIICPSALSDVDKLDTTPAETGPFKLGESVRGNKYVLERREGSVVSDLDTLPEKITIRVSTSDSTRANLFETGEVQIASIEGRDVERLEGKFDSIPGMGFGAIVAVFNQAGNSLGTNPAVREILALSTNRESYSNAASKHLTTPSDTLYTSNVTCFDEANVGIMPEFDVDKAKDKLAQAGFTSSNPLKIHILADETHGSGPEYLADEWRKLGIEVDLNVTTFDQMVKTVYGNGKWDVLLYSGAGASAMTTPAETAGFFSDQAGSGDMPLDVKNAVYDQAVKQAFEAGPDEACAHWAEAEKALLDETSIIPLVRKDIKWFTKDLEFHGEYFKLDLRSIRVKE